MLALWNLLLYYRYITEIPLLISGGGLVVNAEEQDRVAAVVRDTVLSQCPRDAKTLKLLGDLLNAQSNEFSSIFDKVVGHVATLDGVDEEVVQMLRAEMPAFA
jgi:hypothetical protein